MQLGPTLIRLSSRISPATGQLSIYNRCGETIWKGENEGWNGTSGGAMVPEGVYLYLLKATDDMAAPHYFKGNVTVVK